MSIKNILILSLVLIVQQVKAQVYVNNSAGSCPIYAAVLKKVTTENKGGFYVQKNTSNTLLKTIRFNDLDKYLLVTKRVDINDDWKLFLRGIDTAKIQRYPIGCDFSEYGAFKTVVKNEHLSYSFSSVVLSADGSKAICTWESFNVDTSNGWVFRLEKIKGEWVVIQMIRLYIS